MSSEDLRRDVFLQCRTVFAGQNAQIRRPKKILQVLQQHQTKIQSLLSKYDLNTIADGARILLEKRVFESSLSAKIEFPQLYEISAGRGAQRTASESEAFRSEAEALAEAEPGQRDSLEGRSPSSGIAVEYEDLSMPAILNGPTSLAGLVHGVSGSIADPLPGRSPTLFPVYLPYRTQHRVLTGTQTLLERVCFDFGKKWMPELLVAKQWDCPEAVELTKWTKTLAEQQNKIPFQAINTISGFLSDDFIFALHRLRHAAVHRLPTTAAGVQQMISSAGRLAATLRDTARAAKIERIHHEVQIVVRDLEGNKELLESKLDQELKAIEEARVALDRREQEAMATMNNEDREYQASVSLVLDETVAAILEEVWEMPFSVEVDTVHLISSDDVLHEEDFLQSSSEADDDGRDLGV